MRNRGRNSAHNDMRSRIRICAVVFAVLVAVLPASASKRLTIEQLKQIFNSAAATHRNDNESAQQLSDVQLTARMDSSVLRQLVAESPGPKTSLAVRALSDNSAFLDPSPENISTKPVPDIAAQKAMMGQVVHFVARTLPTLPNLQATRVTQHFVDSTQALKLSLDPAVRETTPELLGGLFLAGINRTSIALRDGRETDQPLQFDESPASLKKTGEAKTVNRGEPKTASISAANLGLASWGEFGPILGLVLVDAAKGKLGWARWEQENGKPVAVFQFAVDRSISHYTVQYWHVNRGEVVDSHYGSRQDERHGGGNNVSAGEVKDRAPSLLRQTTGYHGYLAVDPETGTILRISIEADLKAEDPIQRAAIEVEYGPVKIGDGLFTCPIHSVAVSVSSEQYQASPINPIVLIREQQLNDVEFTAYRRFGSESTLITDVASTSGQTDEVAAIPSGATSTPGPDSEIAEADPQTDTHADSRTDAGATASAADASAAESGSSAESSLTVAPKPSPAESDEEILVKAADSMPGIEGDSAVAGAANAQPGNNNSSSFTLKVTTRSVDLSLIATDKHGKPITDLKKDEIEIYDNGRRQQLRAFNQAASTTPSTAPVPSAPSETFTNSVQPAQTQNAPDTLILLLDESHLAYLDLNVARTEIQRFLKSTRANSRVALYALNEKGFRVILDATADHALVEAKLAAWTPAAGAVSQAQDLESRNRQQFDTVRNTDDLNSVNGNTIQAPDYITSTDPQLRLLGNNPLGYALGSMIALARHFSPVPGHKSLVWISGDSALEDWEDQAVGKDKGDQQLQSVLSRTREALNESHMALYAVDASAVQGGAIDASLANVDVGLNPVATANSRPGGAALPRDTGGRIKEQMLENTRAIQAPVRLLAETTGGRAVNKGSDLKATLDHIDEDSASLYEIAFDPDTPADGKFHTLSVRIPTRKDVKLRYRSGYLYSEDAGTTKDRFQQAVWSPQDLTGIALTAEDVPAAESATGKNTVKLRIAFPGLAFVQKDSRWTDQIYVFVAVRDDAAQKAEVNGDTLRLSLKQATYDSGMPAGIPYQTDVEAKSRLGTVRIIVVDGNSGKIGSVTLPSSALHH